MLRLFLLLLATFLLTAPPASAHVLKTDGSIGAVIHVDPEDDPIAGTPTNFYFEFKDKTGRFTPDNCNCRVSVHTSDKELYSETLTSNRALTLSSTAFSYTFPEKNLYIVKINGTPKTPGIFDEFELAYDIRVARSVTGEQSASSNSTEAQLPIIPIVAGLVLFFGLIFAAKKLKTRHLILLFLLNFVFLYNYPSHTILPHHHDTDTTHDERYPCTAAYTSNIASVVTITPYLSSPIGLSDLSLSSCNQTSPNITRIRSPPFS